MKKLIRDVVLIILLSMIGVWLFGCDGTIRKEDIVLYEIDGCKIHRLRTFTGCCSYTEVIFTDCRGSVSHDVTSGKGHKTITIQTTK